MRTAWPGIVLSIVVLYFGLAHSASVGLLFNFHAITLVCGGTLAISLLANSPQRLLGVVKFAVFGFFFRMRSNDVSAATDLICHIDAAYGLVPTFKEKSNSHPFLHEAFRQLKRSDLDFQPLEATLKDRRNALKRRYIDDAKILASISKYPPALGLLGAASGMIEMMTGLGQSGVEHIGAAMALALSATVWGIGMSNFIFLPLSDNSMKAAEDELYLRDMIIEGCLNVKRGMAYDLTIESCLNRLDLSDRIKLKAEHRRIRAALDVRVAA